MQRRVLKILHELGAIGLTGALAVHMILLVTAPEGSAEGYAVVRSGIDALCSWLLLPSLAVCLLSGIFAIWVHPPFQRASWVWLKLILGLPVFQATVLAVHTIRQGTALAASAATGEVDPALLAEAMDREWKGLWVIMALAIAQTVLGVWRPRSWQRTKATGSASA